MAKKQEVKDEAVATPISVHSEMEQQAPKSTKREKMLPVTVDFGREDLNNLGNKVNEIIMYLNEQN